MSRFFAIFLLLFSTFTKVQGAAETSNFFPKLYNSFWPDFCLEHLRKFPKACSQYSAENYTPTPFTSKKRNFYLTFEKHGAAESYIDQEIISHLSSYLNYIPSNTKNCNFKFCKDCKSSVRYGEKFDDDDDDDDDDDGRFLVLNCNCFNYWKDPEVDPEVLKSYIPCTQKALPTKYFDIHSKQFIHFLELHLKYIQENQSCLCYWPYLSKRACQISDILYEKLYPMMNISLCNLREQEFNAQDFPFLQNRTKHGVLTGLFIHCFFYSQYKEVLYRIAQWEETHDQNSSQVNSTTDALYETLDDIQEPFLQLYSQCLEKHPHPKIYYERGMIYFDQGLFIDSLSDILALIDLSEKNHQDDFLSSELYFKKGILYADLGLYDKAIEDFTKAIHKNPENKQIYFERSCAYFELGNFEKSLEDYLASGFKPKSVTLQFFPFSLGLTKGIMNGGIHGGVEFLPSLFSSMQFLGHGLWAFTKDPVKISQELAETCQDCILFIKNHSTSETIKKLIPELKDLIEKWNELQDEKRGEMAGYIIGKYGIEIFASAGIAKGIKLFSELKKADRILTLEAMAISERNKIFLKSEFAKQNQSNSLKKNLVKSNPSLRTNLSLSQKEVLFSSATKTYDQNITTVAHSFSKHAGRHPETWGKLNGAMSTWHEQALQHLNDICNAPGDFTKVLDRRTGLIWIEKRLQDGRGVRLNLDHTFKGFID